MAEFIGSSGSFTDQQIRDVVNTFASDPYNNPDIRFLLSQGLISDKDFRTGDQLSPEDLAKRATVYALQQALGMPQGEAEAAMATAFIDPVEDQAALQDLAAAYEQSMLGGISNEDYLAAAGRAGLTSVDQYDVMRLLEAGNMFSKPGSGGLESGYPSAPAIVEAGQHIAESGVGNMIFTPEYDAPGSDTNRFQLAQGIVNAEDEAAKLAARKLANTQQANMNAAAKANAENKALAIQQEAAAKRQMLQPRNRQFQIEAPRGFVGEAETVGAASDEPMGAGSASYKSELIKSLRNANENPFSSNKGVTLRPNRENSGLTLDFNRAAPGGLTNAGANKPIDTKPDNPVVPKPPGDKSGGGGAGSGGGNFIGGDWVGNSDEEDPDPWDPANDGEDPDPWDPANDGEDPDPWDPANDGDDPDVWDPANDGDDPDVWDPALDTGDDSWSEWGDWGGEEEDLQNMLDAPDTFNDLFDFGLGFGGGGRGGKSTDDMLAEMLQV